MIKELSKKKGFSLVELIVVIAIIGILAAIAVPKYSQYQKSAKVNADKATASMIADAVLMAYETGEINILPQNSNFTVVNEVGTDWSKIMKYISGNATITSDSGLKWSISIDKGHKKIKVFADGTMNEAGDAGAPDYDNTVIKAELEY